jgi:hypothetical protein
VGLERSSLSLVSTIEELLGRNSSGSGLETREYGREHPLRWPRDTVYPQKLALTSQTSGGRSVGIVRLRAKTTEFFFVFFFQNNIRKIFAVMLSWAMDVRVVVIFYSNITEGEKMLPSCRIYLVNSQLV